MNWTVKKKVNFVNVSKKRRIISLRHSSILRRILLNFMALRFVFIRQLLQFSHFFSDFQLFRPEHHWRDLSSQNAHLVHQNCLRISFTFVLVYMAYILPSYNTDQTFINAHFRQRKCLGLFMYTIVPCSLFFTIAPKLCELWS
jgi:hypothetical protein